MNDPFFGFAPNDPIFTAPAEPTVPGLAATPIISAGAQLLSGLAGLGASGPAGPALSGTGPVRVNVGAFNPPPFPFATRAVASAGPLSLNVADTLTGKIAIGVAVVLFGALALRLVRGRR